MSDVKTGSEFLASFFKDLKERKDLDVAITSTLAELFETGKFTDKNISNSLDKIRNEKSNENKTTKS